MGSECKLPGEDPATLVTPQHSLVGGTVAVFGVSDKREGVTETPATLSARVNSAV